MSKEMPEGGVKKLLTTSGGRRELKDMQKKYRKDLLQPTHPNGKRNPEFFKEYGQKIDTNTRLMKIKADMAQKEKRGITNKADDNFNSPGPFVWPKGAWERIFGKKG